MFLDSLILASYNCLLSIRLDHLMLYTISIIYIWLQLADKPPIEELHQFLAFQLLPQWAPVFSDLPLGPQRRQQSTASLQFSFLGPKLHVNTSPVNLLLLLVGFFFFLP